MEDSYYQQMANVQKDHWWYRGRRKILSYLIANLPLKKESPVQILEIGCGTGANLKMLQEFGDVHGVEPHQFARHYSQNLSGCDIQEGLLPDQIPFKKSFDLIGAFDVIEHVEDDKGSLIALRDKLSADGFALFTIPAFQWLWSKHDEMNHHKRRYTRKQFQALLNDTGYKIHFISYYNTWLFPLAAFARLIHKIQKSNSDTGDIKIPRYPIVNHVLYKILSSERFILKKGYSLPFGLSIIAVCQKV